MPKTRHFTALIAGLLTLGPSAEAAQTTIVNRALAQALEDRPGAQPFEVWSNEVQTTVQPVCAVSVTPDGSATRPGQRLSVRSGEAATFVYQVSNSGNETYTFNLSAQPVGVSTAVLTAGALRLYRDLNANGALDAGEPALEQLTLEPGARAGVLLVVSTAAAGAGTAYLSLGATCPAASGGSGDFGNVAELRIEGVARLAFEKTFGAAQATPGGRVPVTLRVRNEGNGVARDIVVSDPLNTPELTGLGLLPGSARASAGEVSAQAAPAALRWTLARLEAGQSAELTFDLTVAAAAAMGERVNVASLTSSTGTPLQASAVTSVGAAPALALGPGGNPDAAPGGELSASDTQARTGSVVRQPVCFPHTLRNAGNVEDLVTLRAALDSGEAEVSFRTPGGEALAQPLRLAVGERVDFQACVTPSAAADVTVRLSAVSSVGAAQNSTIDRLGGIDARTVGLLKTVDAQGTVRAGTTLTYTLSVTNPYAFALTGVTLRDPLDPALDFVSADGGGTFEGGAVSWSWPSLAPGETRRLTVVARVRSDAADGRAIENRFSLVTDQTPSEQRSGAVLTPVWSAALVAEKLVSSAEAVAGDRLTYRVRLRNTSTSAALRGLTVTDRLPAGLVYLPGSARLGDAALADPGVSGGAGGQPQVLSWTLPGELPASGSLTLSYDVRVLPGAALSLTNVVSATAEGGPEQVIAAIASNQAQVAVQRRAGLFAAQSAVLGRVFVDRNGNSLYDAEVDTPLERARVLLAGGRSALTDAQGRYHFADVAGPVAALRLDPHSVPYPPRRMPDDGGRPGSRAALLTGLTSVDFPLEPLLGTAQVTRSTTLRSGPLTLTKTVSLEPGGSFAVRLSLSAAAPLADVELSDPLPAGAALLEGAPSLSLPALPMGERTLTYRFRLSAPPAPGALDTVTDPVIRWRFP